jgi:hypothetical protein
MQLPPALSSSPACQNQDAEPSDGSVQTLSRTLFERLALLGAYCPCAAPVVGAWLLSVGAD